MAENRFEIKRNKMVKEQLIDAGITDLRVLKAMSKIPRHLFMLKETRSSAYKNKATKIMEGQTISQPFVVAKMTEMIGLTGNEKVLEIGTGSGYQTAILAELSKEVISVERHKKLADQAQLILSELGYKNIKIIVGDGTMGLANFKPFQAIMVTAAAPNIPQILLDQLAEGGRMVAPVGTENQQYLTLFRRKGDQYLKEGNIPVVFVPLIGEYGWKEEEWNRLRKHN